MSDFGTHVIGKIVIDFSQKYASVYICDGEGKVRDSDHFRFPYELTRKDVVSEVNDMYAMVYDWLNDTLNDDSDEAAREGDPPATTD